MTFLPNSPESLDGFLFGQMAEDMNGNLYIATEHGRLNCLDRTTQKVKRYDRFFHVSLLQQPSLSGMTLNMTGYISALSCMAYIVILPGV